MVDGLRDFRSGGRGRGRGWVGSRYGSGYLVLPTYLPRRPMDEATLCFTRSASDGDGDGAVFRGAVGVAIVYAQRGFRISLAFPLCLKSAE